MVVGGGDGGAERSPATSVINLRLAVKLLTASRLYFFAPQLKIY